MSECESTPSVKLSHRSDGTLVAQTSTGATTSNQLEVAAALQMQDAGYEVIRNGWPDFIAIRGDEVVFVEVKPDNNERLFSPAQKRVLTVLKSLGLTVKVIAPRAQEAEEPATDDFRHVLDVIRCAKSVGIMLCSSGGSVRTWLPKLIESIPSEMILVVPDTRAWNRCRAAQAVAVRRRLFVRHVHPTGRIPNLEAYERAAASKVVRNSAAMIVITDGNEEGCMWAIEAASHSLKPLVVLRRDGTVVRLKKEGG